MGGHRVFSGQQGDISGEMCQRNRTSGKMCTSYDFWLSKALHAGRERAQTRGAFLNAKAEMRPIWARLAYSGPRTQLEDMRRHVGHASHRWHPLETPVFLDGFDEDTSIMKVLAGEASFESSVHPACARH